MHDKIKNSKTGLSNGKVMIFLCSIFIFLIFVAMFMRANQTINSYQLDHIKLLSSQQCTTIQKCYGVVQKRLKIRSIGELKQKDYKTVIDLLNSL